MKNNFLQPVISSFGLAISLIVAILPVFKINFISNLFISPKYSTPTSFLAFIIGISIIWLVIQHQPYIQVNIGKIKDRGRGFPQPWRTIQTTGLIWLMILLSVVAGFSFIAIGAELAANPTIVLTLVQSFLYLVFFLAVITIFSLLFALTKNRYDWEEQRDNLPQIIFQTLEKNRLIKPWIEIYENRDITAEELGKEGIPTFVLCKRIKIKTQVQKEEIIECIISSDGKQIIKVLKKETQK